MNASALQRTPRLQRCDPHLLHRFPPVLHISSKPQCKRAQNLRPYDFLDVRLRGDGGTYLLNVRLDQLTGGDEEVWQAPLRTRWGFVVVCSVVGYKYACGFRRECACREGCGRRRGRRGAVGAWAWSLERRWTCVLQFVAQEQVGAWGQQWRRLEACGRRVWWVCGGAEVAWKGVRSVRCCHVGWPPLTAPAPP